MTCAWKECVGIGVDVHVHRVSNRLGWCNETKTPEQSRKELEDWIPQEYWPDFNWMIVGFGQTVCLPVRPKCAQCPLADSCPSASRYLASCTRR